MYSISLLLIILTLLNTISSYEYDLDLFVGPPNEERGLNVEEKLAVLTNHNKLRAHVAMGRYFGKPKAANMIMLYWNEDAAMRAQSWADNCDGPPDAPNLDDGQNSELSKDKDNVLKNAVDEWFENEPKRWKWTGGIVEGVSFKKIAEHFSQIVWATTTSVGCGYNKCKGKQPARFICNYVPRGNIEGQTPYIVGEPCTRCPKGFVCADGALCEDPAAPNARAMNGTGRPLINVATKAPKKKGGTKPKGSATAFVPTLVIYAFSMLIYNCVTMLN